MPNESHRDYFLGLMESNMKPPGRSLIYKHRFMFAMGYCSFLAAEAKELLAAGEPTRWGTIDASPQAGWDWVLHGRISLSKHELVVSFREANMYIQLSIAQRAAMDNHQDFHQSNKVEGIGFRLAKKLRLRLALPTAVGAGRAGIRHKLHSLVHGERMTSPSWPSAVTLMNSTFSITGDMGTESHICQCRVSLRDLMGAWGSSPSPGSAAGDTEKDPLEQSDALASEQSGFAFESELGGCDAPGDAFNFEDIPQGGVQPGHAAAAGEDGAAGGAEDWGSSVIDLRHCLYVPGLLHMGHNCVHDLHAVLSGCWEDYVNQLRHVCQMLPRRRSRTRLQETCLNAEPYCHFKEEFGKFSAKVYEGRRGLGVFS